MVSSGAVKVVPDFETNFTHKCYERNSTDTEKVSGKKNKHEKHETYLCYLKFFIWSCQISHQYIVK